MMPKLLTFFFFLTLDVFVLSHVKNSVLVFGSLDLEYNYNFFIRFLFFEKFFVIDEKILDQEKLKKFILESMKCLLYTS